MLRDPETELPLVLLRICVSNIQASNSRLFLPATRVRSTNMDKVDETINVTFLQLHILFQRIYLAIHLFDLNGDKGKDSLLTLSLESTIAFFFRRMCICLQKFVAYSEEPLGP